MVNLEADDVESAYGSEISEEKEHFSDEKKKEIPTENSVWYRWIKNRLNRITILEIIVIVLLVLLIFNSFRTTTSTDNNMIFNINSKVENMEKMNFNMNSKIENVERIVEKLQDDHKNEDLYNQLKDLIKKNGPFPINPIEKETKIEEIVVESVLPLYQINAADFMLGAHVEIKLSSSSNLNSYIWRDQSDLVLLDRPNPPADKVWCTFDKDPVITISLATFVKPTAISYQHFKWEGEIPKGALKRYSVHACIDYYCETTVVIASNCRYQLTPDDQQEQFCQLLPNKNLTSISKVQFKFHQNHGNTEETCVSLIRFYGEAEKMPKTREKEVGDSKRCSDLKNEYHDSPFMYQMSRKDCKTLYSYECCDECPECCAECQIVDFNFGVIVLSILVTFLVGIIGFFVFFSVVGCLACCGVKWAEKMMSEMQHRQRHYR